MSMVNELVKTLRDRSFRFAHDIYFTPTTKDLLSQAADAIEELSAKVARQNMERSNQYYGENKKVFECGDEVLVKGTISIKNGSNYFVDIQVCGIWEAEENIFPLPQKYEPKED